MTDVSFEFFSITPTSIIGTLINTFILFMVFKKLLFAPVNRILEERKSQVSKTYEEADAALKKAQSMESEYEEKLAAAKEETAEMMRNASRKAQSRSDEIIAAAKNEADAITRKAGEDIEKERKRAINQIKDDISDIALSVAGKIIGRELESDDEQDRLIDEFIGSIDEES